MTTTETNSDADTRSVGELLTQCDQTARTLLLDPDALDPATMVRAWPELVQAGHEFLDALPGPGTAHRIPGVDGVHTPGDPVGERLHLMATALHDTLRARPWPGPGPADERLLTMTGALVRAHDLVHRHLRTTSAPKPAVQADAAAARTRVLHTLYVTAHALSLAATRRTRELQSTRAGMQRRWAVHELSALRVLAARADALEQYAGTEVYQGFPGALHGQPVEPAAPNRLRTALAAWDIQTHRALATTPSMDNVMEVTRVQATSTALTHVLLDAAADGCLIDAGAYRARLDPDLADAENAWGALHGLTRDLTRPGNRTVTADLRVAGSELVHALTELALDGNRVADRATLIERVRHHDTASTLIQALQSHPNTAQLVRDVTLDPRLRVSAPSAQRVITSLTVLSLLTASPPQPWLAPRDIALKRHVAPPAPIRDALAARVEQVEHATRHTATSATAMGGATQAATLPTARISQQRRAPQQAATPARSITGMAR